MVRLAPHDRKPVSDHSFRDRSQNRRPQARADQEPRQGSSACAPRPRPGRAPPRSPPATPPRSPSTSAPTTWASERTTRPEPSPANLAVSTSAPVRARKRRAGARCGWCRTDTSTRWRPSRGHHRVPCPGRPATADSTTATRIHSQCIGLQRVCCTIAVTSELPCPVGRVGRVSLCPSLIRKSSARTS
jgi:hypothetical protein